jgi:hypothetical protein
MMATIKLEEEIQPDLYPIIRSYLTLAYGAGYDHGRNEIQSKGSKGCIVQYNLDGKVINTFSSVQEAERKTGHNHKIIESSCKGTLHKTHKFRWKRIEKEKSEKHPGPF